MKVRLPRRVLSAPPPFFLERTHQPPQHHRPPTGPASSRAGGDRDPPSHSRAAAPRSRVTSRDPRTRHRRVFGPFPRPRAPSIPAGWRLTSIPPFIRTFFFCLPTEQLIQRSRGFRRIRRGACAGRLGEARAVLPRRVAREVGAADAFNTNAIGVFLIARLPATLARRSRDARSPKAGEDVRRVPRAFVPSTRRFRERVASLAAAPLPPFSAASIPPTHTPTLSNSLFSPRPRARLRTSPPPAARASISAGRA